MQHRWKERLFYVLHRESRTIWECSFNFEKKGPSIFSLEKQSKKIGTQKQSNKEIQGRFLFPFCTRSRRKDAREGLLIHTLHCASMHLPTLTHEHTHTHTQTHSHTQPYTYMHKHTLTLSFLHSLKLLIFSLFSPVHHFVFQREGGRMPPFEKLLLFPSSPQSRVPAKECFRGANPRSAQPQSDTLAVLSTFSVHDGRLGEGRSVLCKKNT